MRRKIFRILSVFLTALMIIFISACSGTKNTDETKGTKGTETKETEGTKETPAPEIRTLSVLCMSGRSAHYPEHSLENIDDYIVYQAFEEALTERGLALEYEMIPPDQYRTSLQTKLASGTKLPDLVSFEFTSDDRTVLQYGKNGLIIDVKAAVDQYDDDGSIFAYWDATNPQAKGMLTTEDGKIYWFPYIYRLGLLDENGKDMGDRSGGSFQASIRKDWLDAVGIEYSMFMTPDELFDALLAFNTQDANGNGLNDEVITVGIGSFNNGIANGFGLTSRMVAILEGMPEVQCQWYAPGIKDYIAFMQKLYNHGLYNTASLGEGVNQQLLIENKSSLSYTYAAGIEEEKITNVDAEYAPIIVDNDAGADGFYYDGAATFGLVGMWSISKDCDDVEAAVDLYDYFFTDEFMYLAGAGIEGETYEFDEFGGIVKLFTNDDVANGEKNVPLFYYLTMNALPHLHRMNNTFESTLAEAKKASILKSEMVKFIITNDMNYIHQPEVQPLAMATDQELEKLQEIETILDTYSSELLTGLILGEKSLEDFDTYIAEMQDLGLDDYIAIYQDRYDRFLAANQ